MTNYKSIFLCMLMITLSFYVFSLENNNSDIQDSIYSNKLEDVQNIDRKIEFKTGHIFLNGVTSIESNSTTSAFFVGGSDGFISKYTYPDLDPDTWQLSSIPIKKMVLHPNGNYLAIYESDDVSDHRLSLWSWNRKECLFTKKFDNSIVSLSWSAKGSYLFVGNTSLTGINVFDIDGNELSIFKDPPGIVLVSATGGSEKTVVTYGETGRLVYTNILEKKFIKQSPTESLLESPSLIKKFTQIIGYKDNLVYVIDAISGKTIKKYDAISPIFASKETDSIPLWIDKGDKSNSWCIRQGSNTSSSFSLPNDMITVAKYIGNNIIIGTKTGNIFSIKLTKTSKVICSKISVPKYKQILDISNDDKNVFILTKDAIYYTNSHDNPVKMLTNVNNVNKCIFYANGLILWSNNKIAPMYYYSFESNKIRIIYRPIAPVTSMSVYKDKVTITDSFSGVYVFNINTSKNEFVYKATGIQSAVQINDDQLLISKSSIDNNKTPIFIININTNETVPLSISGDFAFSLMRNNSYSNKLNGFILSTDGDKIKTDLVSIVVNTDTPVASTVSLIASYMKEDLDAFVTSNGSILLTNLGNYSLIYHNDKSKQTFSLPKVYTLSKKAIFLNNKIVTLNTDSSMTWYNTHLFEVDGISHISL